VRVCVKCEKLITEVTLPAYNLAVNYSEVSILPKVHNCCGLELLFIFHLVQV